MQIHLHQKHQEVWSVKTSPAMCSLLIIFVDWPNEIIRSLKSLCALRSWVGCFSLNEYKKLQEGGRVYILWPKLIVSPPNYVARETKGKSAMMYDQKVQDYGNWYILLDIARNAYHLMDRPVPYLTMPRTVLLTPASTANHHKLTFFPLTTRIA